MTDEAPRSQGCAVPPSGWFCTREPGHEGPCAAYPVTTPNTAASAEREALIQNIHAALGGHGWAYSQYGGYELTTKRKNLEAVADLLSKESGYVDAFYEIGEILGIGARPASPKHVWETEMRPRLRELMSRPRTVTGRRLDLKNAAAVRVGDMVMVARDKPYFGRVTTEFVPLPKGEIGVQADGHGNRFYPVEELIWFPEVAPECP